MRNDSDALFEAGRRAHESGDLAGARAAYQTALHQRPDDPKLLYLLGNVHLDAGDAQAALTCLKAAAARERNHPAVIGSLAQAYFELGDYTEAENQFRKATRLDPRTPQLQIGLANALAVQRKFGDAETLLKRVLSRHPDAAYAWMNLGNVARDQLRLDEAAAHYREALRCDQNLVDARNNLGSVLHTLLRFEEAEQTYRACLAIDPGFLLARSNLASVLIDLGRFDQAEAHARELLAQAPDSADAHATLGAAVGSQGRLTEALPHYRQAAALAPDVPRHISAYAAALCELGDIDPGLRLFGRLLKQWNEPLETVQMVTLILLANGFFAEGFSRYRLRQSFLRIQSLFTRLDLQQALPGDLRGKHLGIVGEQGLGDELFFLRFVPRLKTRGVRVTYCCNPKLASILRRATDIDHVVTNVEHLPPTDINLLACDLPDALDALRGETLGQADTSDASLLSEFPWRRGTYAPLPPPSLTITPLAAAIDAMRARLAEAGPPPYLGITWRGGTAPEQQRGVEWKLFKEVPIAQLAQALSAWPGTLIALQRLPAAGELAALQSALGRRVADFTAVNEDLEQMLALMSLIDEYVGVSNTNVHLRALVNQPTRVLVPCPAEWRWMAAGASPWFPGSCVYRQTPDSRWDDALGALRRDLMARV